MCVLGLKINCKIFQYIIIRADGNQLFTSIVEIEEKIKKSYETDEYNHMVHPGQKYYDGFFLEEDSNNSKGKFFRLVRKKAFVLRKSIIYPLVQLMDRKNKLYITNEDYVEILVYVEDNGLVSL